MLLTLERLNERAAPYVVGELKFLRETRSVYPDSLQTRLETRATGVQTEGDGSRMSVGKDMTSVSFTINGV
jgi:hypothetical protein